MRARRARDEAGYVALLAALLCSTVFLGLAALGVDTARWYVEAERLQKAADAAALSGVVYMPADLGKARAAAIATAEDNGYAPGAGITIDVAQGSLPSRLDVTISSSVANAFASTFGISRTVISRSATADYAAPAPMGSPCNTFGNEPPSTTGTVNPTGSALPTTTFPNCKSNPQFWAAVEGPATDKVNGDRYGNRTCSSGVYRCSSGVNTEYRPEGYFWSVHVEPSAVGTPIDVQLYDPAFVQTGKDCESIDQTYVIGRMNSYTPSDGVSRYDSAQSIYCSGDYLGSSGSKVTTSYTMREQTPTGDPMKGAVIDGCTQQFTGTTSSLQTPLRQWTTATGNTEYNGYNPELSRVFHQWVSLCTFTPRRTGDYYLQVRTNVPVGGVPVPNQNPSGALNPIVYKGNSAVGAATGSLETGVGVNSFAIRAVPSNASMRNQVAVAGYSRMPILQNAAGGTAQFNLIRAMPAAKGQYISFSFFDVSDCGGGCSGTVKVLRPADATGSIRSTTSIVGCKAAVDPAAYAAVNNCTATVSSGANNGKLETMIIPIPNDYSCDPSTLGGCWFSVSISFDNGANVSDITTWDANIGGDPVRLVE